MGCRGSRVLPYPLYDTDTEEAQPAILAAKQVEVEDEKKEEEPRPSSKYGYGTRNMSIFYTTTRGIPKQQNKFMRFKFLYRVPKASSGKININPFDDEEEYTYSLKSTKVLVDDPSALRILRKLT